MSQINETICSFNMFYNYFMYGFKVTNKLLLVGQYVINILAQLIVHHTVNYSILCFYCILHASTYNKLFDLI